MHEALDSLTWSLAANVKIFQSR